MGVWGVPYYDKSITYPQTLFYFVEGPYITDLRFRVLGVAFRVFRRLVSLLRAYRIV